MYDHDMPLIREHGLRDASGFADVCTFVLLTIQQPFQQMARQFEDVQRHGSKSRYLFGSKRTGFEYIKAHKEVLFAAVTKALQARDYVGGIDVLTNIPSLGMVKAAFVMQCLGADTACLDTHNLARLGKPAAFVKLAKTLKHETRLKKIADYVAFCSQHGNARYWWDTWCEYVAGRRNSPLKTAREVSAFHAQALGLS